MFERYNVNDLFLASINIIHNEKKIVTSDKFGISFEGAIEGFGYITIVKKEEDKYIDLQNPKRKLVTKSDLNETSYIIEYIEPLSKYYKNKEGKSKLCKRKTLKLAENYYADHHKNQMNYMNKKINEFHL